MKRMKSFGLIIFLILLSYGYANKIENENPLIKIVKFISSRTP
jgi:hypothetical protein